MAMKHIMIISILVILISSCESDDTKVMQDESNDPITLTCDSAHFDSIQSGIDVVVTKK